MFLQVQMYRICTTCYILDTVNSGLKLGSAKHLNPEFGSKITKSSFTMLWRICPVTFFACSWTAQTWKKVIFHCLPNQISIERFVFQTQKSFIQKNKGGDKMIAFLF
jgi:hypothetical protein